MRRSARVADVGPGRGVVRAAARSGGGWRPALPRSPLPRAARTWGETYDVWHQCERRVASQHERAGGLRLGRVPCGLRLRAGPPACTGPCPAGRTARARPGSARRSDRAEGPLRRRRAARARARPPPTSQPYVLPPAPDLGTTTSPTVLGLPTSPSSPGMHDASAHVVGATVEAVRAVWSGEFDHAVNLAGGLHHAMPEAASGFCVYNDPAVAIAWALQKARNASPTSTWTCTTATGSSTRSGTTPGS